MKNVLIILLAIVIGQPFAIAQDANSLVKKVKAKLDKVNDYVAEGKMRTDVAFIKAPVGKVTVYFKKPDKFKLKRSSGISILPKGGVSISMSSVLSDTHFTAIDAGENTVGGTKVRIVKLLPENESDVVLTTLYIDEANLLIRKANTTTRENGTYEMEMTYGKFMQFGLPDKVIFAFNTKEYKLPKGVTLEFDTGEAPKQDVKNKKGRVEIVYSSYIVNKGVANTEFK